MSTSVPHPKPQQSTSSPWQLRQLPWVWTQNRVKQRRSSSCQSSFSIVRRETRMTRFRAVLSDPAVWTVSLDALDAVSCACLDIYDAIMPLPSRLLTLTASLHQNTHRLSCFQKGKTEWWSSGAPLALVKQHTWSHVLLGMHVLLHETKVFVELGESVRLLLFSLQSFCWLDLSQDDTFTSCSQYLFLDDSNLLWHCWGLHFLCITHNTKSH